MAELAHEAKLDVDRPFSRADARRAGIPVKHLKSARFRKLFHDVYLGADANLTPVILASAALGISPFGSYASHHTAAGIWGGIVPDQPLTHVSSPPGATRSERRGVGSHRSSQGSVVVTFAGIRVSSPEQTFIDLATELSLVDLVVLGDSLVKRGRTSTRRLVEEMLARSGRGCRAARRAARLVRAEVDSPMETRLRLLMVFAGLPEPVVNYIERGQRGTRSKRFDLSYPDLLLIIEYDGLQHAENDKQYSRDLERREELDAAGWRVIVIRSADIYVKPKQTLERITEALRLAGARDLPRTFDSEWERHFPGR
jgi:very-short-patch-repair endonuclease